MALVSVFHAPPHQEGAVGRLNAKVRCNERHVCSVRGYPSIHTLRTGRNAAQPPFPPPSVCALFLLPDLYDGLQRPRPLASFLFPISYSLSFNVPHLFHLSHFLTPIRQRPVPSIFRFSNHFSLFSITSLCFPSFLSPAPHTPGSDIQTRESVCRRLSLAVPY